MQLCMYVHDSAIMELPSHYSICLSQMKYQMKSFWLKVSVLYEQLLGSVPYATLPHMQHCLCSLYTKQSINYFGQKLTLFLQI